MDSCKHKYVYGGVKYQVQDYKNPGSGSSPVYYYDFYYCEKCLHKKLDKLDVVRTSYDPILFEATPV